MDMAYTFTGDTNTQNCPLITSNVLLKSKFIPNKLKIILIIKIFVRKFKIGEVCTAVTIILAFTYFGKITFEKGKDRYRKYKNQVQQADTVSGSVPEPPIQAAPQIQFNNAVHNPQVVSTVSLFVVLTIAIPVIVNIYLQTFEIMWLMLLGVHRIFICLALPLYFYIANPSMRQFINELYFNL